jgi:LmbE family N-acetylglucosaminyl deacetylase
MLAQAALAVLLVPIAASSQPPRPLAAGELARRIERLGVVGNVLYVAAHPDDENTRLLAWLVGEKKVRAAYLSMTRGDGGQNLIGSEQGPLLGLIRTQELLAARRIDGAEQLFTRARDFGYSKRPEETLAIWGRDQVLADVVWIIRRFKPDLIITRFPSGGFETHGHHTSSAILAEAAFRAAADPAFHPEQVKQVGVWQPRRILWNKFLWNAKPNEDLSGFLKVDVGGYDPLLGLGWGEIAAQSRSMHKSQGFGAAPQRGHDYEYFQVIAGQPAQHSPFDGIDLTWGRVRGADKLAALVRRVQHELQPEHPETVLPLLMEAHAALQALPDNPWKEGKLAELETVIAGCAGLHLEVAAAEYSVTAGGALPVKLTALNRSTASINLEEVRLPGNAHQVVGKPLLRDVPLELATTFTVPADTATSNPYWLAERPQPGLFTVPDPTLIGLPEAPAALVAELTLTVAGRRLTLTRPVAFKWTDPVAGERYRAVEILPPVTVTPERSVLMFADGRPRELRVTVKAGAPKVEGTVRIELPEGFSAAGSSHSFALAARGDETSVVFTLTPPASATSGLVRFVADVGEAHVMRGLTHIEHPHIPIQTLLPPSEVKVVRFDLKRKHTRVGYINGAGDEVADALRQVGYDVTLLHDEAVATERLGRFEALVVGVRAFNVSRRLPFLHQKLMDYVNEGGTLVVQYNTNNRIAKAPAALGPWPFDVTQDRVTDENARVAFDLPRDPVLRSPNPLAPADFEGWVQERGLYFAGHWDARYRAPLGMSDPGEKALAGSLIVTRYGKGTFIYTGLSLFRQLPAGVPGAFRLLANLIGQ